MTIVEPRAVINVAMRVAVKVAIKVAKIVMLVLSAILIGCMDKPQTQFEMLSSPSPELLAKIEPLIQPSIDFVRKNEKVALETGVELTTKQKKIAYNLGVKQVDQIRVVYVDEFPFPEDEGLVKFAKLHDFDSPMVAGFTYGHGVYIKQGREYILPHELIHVRQFEKLGIEGYMHRYMLELEVMGYRGAPLEVQAYNGAAGY